MSMELRSASTEVRHIDNMSILKWTELRKINLAPNVNDSHGSIFFIFNYFKLFNNAISIETTEHQIFLVSVRSIR
jgi:hypothetical protein